MATFVHLAPESRLASIRRNGIARLRETSAELPRGIYAVPITRNFYVSHQWLRELKRRNAGPIAAVYFKIPDEQTVWLGHYGGGHRKMSAAEAVAAFMEAGEAQGWQVLVPRRIEAKEIHRTRRIPQVVGWRYYPGANGKPPFCTCRFCTRGDYGARKMRERSKGRRA